MDEIGIPEVTRIFYLEAQGYTEIAMGNKTKTIIIIIIIIVHHYNPHNLLFCYCGGGGEFKLQRNDKVKL